MNAISSRVAAVATVLPLLAVSCSFRSTSANRFRLLGILLVFLCSTRMFAGSDADKDGAGAKQLLHDELQAISEEHAQVARQYDGANPEVLQETLHQWREQNAERIQAVEHALAKAIRKEIAAKREPPPLDVFIPTDASAELTQLLIEEGEIAAEREHLHWLYRSAPGQTRTRAFVQWDLANAKRLKAVEQLRAEIVPRSRTLPDEIALPIPPEATALEERYWNDEAALLEEMLAIQEQHEETSITECLEALALWADQNAARLKAHRQMAIELQTKQTIPR